MGERSGLRAAMERLDREHGLDHVELRRRAADVLRRHVGYDVAVWATVDPATAMWTHCLLDGMARDEQLEHEVFANEYGADDVLKLTDLARDPRRAGSLVAAVDGDPTGSARLRELYLPRGFSDELRVVFSDGTSPWGALVLLRAGGRFEPADVEAVAPLSSPFAVSLRTSLLRAAVARPAALDDPPGLLWSDPDAPGRVAGASPEAERLLAAVDDDRAGQVPSIVHAVIARHAAGEPATAALATRDGRWLAFHATTMGDRVAVVVEQVRPYRLADLIVRAHGLTARERDVVELVARGLPTKRIAAALHIAEYTVQDHLKAIFAKFGVRSRQELVASVFFDHYGPRHAAEDTPSPYGWYLDAGA